MGFSSFAQALGPTRKILIAKFFWDDSKHLLRTCNVRRPSDLVVGMQSQGIIATTDESYQMFRLISLEAKNEALHLVELQHSW